MGIKQDLTTVHGVLSWINDENRKAIQRFVLKKLKPGGILYLSYNCLPGWAAAMPVRELMKRFADDTYGATLDMVNAALDSVEKAFAVKSGFFNGNAVAESRFNQIKTADRHYLAHEYFNRDWQPFYFSDIMGEFSNAKVSFIGSAELYDPYLALYTNESGRQMIAGAKDGVMKETLKDYFLNRMFRKDLFMRGFKRLTAREQSVKLGSLQFALSQPAGNVSLTMKFPFGEAKGKEEVYQPVIEALSEKPMTLGDLCARPLLRTGVAVPWFNQLLLNAVRRNLKPDEYVWGILQTLGQRMQKEGKMIQDPEENKAEIRSKLEGFMKTDLPYLKQIGIAQS